MQRPTLVLAALALVVGACREGSRASRLAAEPELSGAHSDLTAHLELRIDEALDPDWPLTKVGDVVIGHDGRLFVSQPQARAVYVLDETGRVTDTIGRQGEGPGEFMGLAALGLLGDTLFASDPDLGRVSFFSPDGDFIRSRQWIADMEPRRVEDGSQLLLLPGPPVALFSGGSALVRPNMMLLPEPPGEEVRRTTLRIPLLKIDAESRVVDTLAWEETTSATVGLRRRGSVFQIAAPFQRHPHTAIMPNGAGVVVARDLESGRASVSVNRIGPGADTLFSRNYTYRPIPVAEADLERSLGDLTVFPPDVDGGPDGPDFMRPLREAGLVPETLPPVTGLVAGQDGSIWLRREEGAADRIAWTVLEKNGEVRGTVSLPCGHRVVAALETVMVAVEEDEFDVPSVLRYRVTR
ncbi:6-bladed beta-propeller [Candidatus Palauibacter sp.]|uniref:6-bladed beta-propeller n=1 Tax=Candidatus Palauibacter sp. TaxID=3101350 RepID=UPI003B51BC1B